MGTVVAESLTTNMHINDTLEIGNLAFLRQEITNTEGPSHRALYLGRIARLPLSQEAHGDLPRINYGTVGQFKQPNHFHLQDVIRIDETESGHVFTPNQADIIFQPGNPSINISVEQPDVSYDALELFHPATRQYEGLPALGRITGFSKVNFKPPRNYVVVQRLIDGQPEDPRHLDTIAIASGQERLLILDKPAPVVVVKPELTILRAVQLEKVAA